MSDITIAQPEKGVPDFIVKQVQNGFIVTCCPPESRMLAEQYVFSSAKDLGDWVIQHAGSR